MNINKTIKPNQLESMQAYASPTWQPRDLLKTNTQPDEDFMITELCEWFERFINPIGAAQVENGLNDYFIKLLENEINRDEIEYLYNKFCGGE